MPTLRRILQVTCIAVFLVGLWPAENMWAIGGGIVGFFIVTFLPGLDV